MALGDPALVYYKKEKHHFNKITGDQQVSHMNPSRVDFEKVYLDDAGTTNNVMGRMVDDLVLLLEWINEMVGTDGFHHVAIKARFVRL